MMNGRWTPVDVSMVGDFQPNETLLYYDGPRTFTVKMTHPMTQVDTLWFVHQFDQEEEFWDYFVRPCTQTEVDMLKENKIPVRDFIREGPALYVVRDYGAEKREMYKIDPDDISEDHYPMAGTYLTRTQGEDEKGF